MERHVANAQKVAEFLEDHPRGGLGLLCRAEIEPLSRARARNTCRRAPARSSPSASRAATRPASRSSRACELFSHLANIGDTRSLIIHPASTTHRQLTDEQKVRSGAGPGRDPPFDRHRDGRRSDRRSGPGAAACLAGDAGQEEGQGEGLSNRTHLILRQAQDEDTRESDDNKLTGNYGGIGR